jgi:signal transduction histidine kinase
MQREVLEFARGERSIFVRRVYLNKFFADIREQLQHEVEGRPIELEMDIDTHVVARFDEMKMTRAVLNLARNAIEAMEAKGGKLRIEAHMDGAQLLMRVIDTGPGIAPEVEGRIFQSFVTAGKANGTGLGLAIVKKIVDEHAGSIEVESSSSGASFTIRLPQERGGSLPPASRG